MERIGLIAGEGRLPAIFAKVAKGRGDTVIAFALKGVTDKGLTGHVDKIHWLDWGDLRKGLLLLATERLKKIILLGSLKKDLFFKQEDKLDNEAKKVLDRIKDKKDYAILNEVTGLFDKIGVKTIDVVEYLKDMIPSSKGTLTRREPEAREWEDINYGKTVAKELSRFDIGQTLAVKDKTVVALEAMEGTDETIKRAGLLSGGGFVVIKVARPNQDMRFDVPLAGLDTLKTVISSGGKVLALEEKKTILIDKDELVKLADENNISIVII